MNYDFTALEKKRTISQKVSLARSSNPTRFRNTLLLMVVMWAVMTACFAHMYMTSDSLLGKIIVVAIGVALIPTALFATLYDLAEEARIEYFVRANPEIVKMQKTEPLFDGMKLGRMSAFYQDGSRRARERMRVGSSELALYGVFRIAGRRIIVDDAELKQFEECGAKYIKKDGWTLVYWQAKDMNLAERYRKWFKIADALNDI